MESPADTPRLELLVHGVGGATAAGMLGDSSVVRVQGDEVAALYRTAASQRTRARAPARWRSLPQREAYCWARLTSGAGSRALWLLLTPFLFVNVAYWMRPGRAGVRRSARLTSAVHDVLLRLFGLSLTLLLVTSAAEASMDLAAWQCGGAPGCHPGWRWTGMFGAWSVGPRLALAALVPAGAVLLLWMLARRTWRAYEAQQARWAASRDTEAEAAAPGDESRPANPLSQRDFWSGRAAGRYRGTHVAAGLATVAALLTCAAWEGDRPTGGAVWFLDVALLLLALSVLAACLIHLALPVLAPEPDTRRVPPPRASAVEDADGHAPVSGALRPTPRAAVVWCSERFGPVLTASAALALLGAVGSVLVPRPGWHTSGALPAVEPVLTGLLATQLGLLALFTGTTGLLRRQTPPGAPPLGRYSPSHHPQTQEPQSRGLRREAAARRPAPRGLAEQTPQPDEQSDVPGAGPAPGVPETPAPSLALPGFGGDGRPALRGFAGPVAVALAYLLGVLFTTGLDLRTEDWFGGTPTPAADAVLPAAPPVLGWQATMLPCWLAVLAVLVLVLVIRVRRIRHRMVPEVLRAYGVTDDQHGSRASEIAGALARARLTDAGPVVLAVPAAAAILLGVGCVFGAGYWGQGPAAVLQDEAGQLLVTRCQQVGSWITAGVVVLLFALGRRAYSDSATRRTVGILWDIGTFWPRAAHPLAPPCYAERAVPDLVSRVHGWCAETGGRLVLSGHSQGSVLTVAAARQLSSGVARDHVALLTYGAPVLRLYARFFPAYFGPTELTKTHAALAGWRNLWRRTDPIGGPTRVPAVSQDGEWPVDSDPPLSDPSTYGRGPAHTLPDPLLGHGEYAADPRYAAERAWLWERMAAASPQPPPPSPLEPEAGAAQGTDRDAADAG